MRLFLERAPVDDDELWLLIWALWGVKLPRRSVCPDHVSPFHAVAHAYFAREPNFAVWYASRGSGKSLALAALGLTKSFVDEADVTILGGSMTQSLNVRQHMADLFAWPGAPQHVLGKDVATLIETDMGTMVKPLPASQTTVRGPHPPLQMLDEVDEMDLAIYDAALGQAMEQENIRGEIMQEYIVASSTWQNPEGTFSTVIDRARENGQPIFTWCWRELLQENGGWMSRRFIDNKRKTVSAQMWKTEYDLNEPAGASRVLDLEKVDQYFIEYPAAIIEEHLPDDDLWVWEHPQPTGSYAVGADWAKEQDKTVIVVIRYDAKPHRVVKLRVVNRHDWKVMIGWYNNDISAYHAAGQHDKTGIGNVIEDFIENDDMSGGFVMVGRPRTQMLLDYVVEFEQGRYLMPRQAVSMFRAHRSTTVADVYAPSKWNGHLPDEFAACSLANRAITAMPTPAAPIVIRADGVPREVDKQFYVKPGTSEAWRHEMGVSEVPEEDWYAAMR